ncbi:MAG: hypothetical protein EU516_00420 [Promethearchaeota archaeon]|nr:MAG: hypothetical protein EU516_00420 [Candidatus Lokiarchaeota archaeon]
MPILNESEIEDLKQTHPKKKVLRRLFLVSGVGISTLGILLLLFGVDLGFTIDTINLSLLIDILIILFGFILASKYFIAPYYLRENSITIKSAQNLRETPIREIKFFSYAISRLLAGVILILIGLLSFLTFGTDVGHEVEFGSAVVLGGPSFFYLTGLPMLGIGFSLLIYFLLSIFRGRFSESENFYFFYEIRSGFPWLTEVPKEDIEAIRYQNNHVGPKLAWIVFFVPFIVLQLMTAIPLFFVEKAGPEFVLSWSFLFYSILEIIALIILVVFQQNYFEIASKEMLYEMWFSPIKVRSQSHIKEDFKDFFDSSQSNRDKKKIDEDNSNNKPFNSKEFSSIVNNTHFQVFQLLFGLFLITISIIMMTQMILFGPLVWWIALTYGIILIVRAFNQDFSNSDGFDISYNLKKQRFTIYREFKFKFQFILFKNVKSLEITKWYRKLDFFDFAAISGLVIFLLIQQFQGWMLADTLTLIIDNIFGTIVMIFFLLLIFLFLCLPINVIEVKTPSITHRINISLTKEGKSFIERAKSNMFQKFHAIFERDMKRVFLIRFGLIISIIVVVCIYMTIYFAFFF